MNMTAAVLQEGLPALPPQVQRFTNDLVAWSKLKVARAITQPVQADAVERDIAAAHRRWGAARPEFARRTADRLTRVVTRLPNDPGLAAFRGVSLSHVGALDAVELIPHDLTPAEIGPIVAALRGPVIVATPAVVPEASNKVLRLRTKSLHCIKETAEISFSDEIVWSAMWVTPTGATGRQWWRRTDFDKGETKSIAAVRSFQVAQQFPQKYSFVFSMLEEDSTNAGDVVDAIWAKLKGKVHEKIEEFADWIAGEIGWDDLGPIIAAILNWVVNTFFGWLIAIFAPDPMGIRTYTVTLNGGTTWVSTGNAILPVTVNHSGAGGRYTAALQFELA
jgi:hypothetical protein